MKWIYPFAIFFLIQARPIAGQSLLVYPGDVTNNGVVNSLDFLHLGMAYNFAGTPRDSNSQAFEPLPASAWSYQFASGLNMAFADCNGDGVVNYYYDAFPLYSNYGLQRSSNVTPDVFINGLDGVDPLLAFDHAAAPATVLGGQLVSLPIVLGTVDNPAEDLYGIAFSIVVDPQKVDINSVMLNLSESSWANPDNDRIWMYKKVSANRVDVAWVRTDKNQKRGFGRIGYVDFVIVVDVVAIQAQQFPVIIEAIKMMDKFGNYATVAGDTLWLTVPAANNVSSTAPTLNEPQISVMPNPVNDRILIRAADNILSIVLVDFLGRIVLENRAAQGNYLELPVPNIPNGPYLIRVQTDKGASFRNIQVQR